MARAPKSTAILENGKMANFDRTAEGIVDDMNLSEIVRERMLTYGSMTIEDRAILDFRDGMKKVHRRIMWSMLQQRHFASGPLVKAAEVNGHVMGHYHPHGDKAIHDAMATMVSFKNPLIHGEGNWGSITSDAGAMRYIECRLSKFAHVAALDNYTHAAIETAQNYTGRETEPLVLIPNIPLALLYGSSGIAVGTTTNIPSFTLASLSRLIRAAMSRTIKNGKFTPITARDCAAILEFSGHYGGHVTNTKNELIEFFSNSEGKIKWSADHHYVESGNYLAITGFPPEWGYASKVVGTPANLKTGKPGKAAKLDAIQGVRDAAQFNHEKTGAQEVRVYFNKMSAGEHEIAMEKVLKEMPSSVSYRLNFTERYLKPDAENPERQPEIAARFFSCTIPEMLNMWIKWRVGQQKIILQLDLAEQQKKLRREQLLLAAIDILDELVLMARRRAPYDKIKNFDKVVTLAERLKCTIDESKMLWEIAIGRFDKLNESEQHAKIEALTSRIAVIEKRIAFPFRATYNYVSNALEGK